MEPRVTAKPEMIAYRLAVAVRILLLTDKNVPHTDPRLQQIIKKMRCSWRSVFAVSQTTLPTIAPAKAPAMKCLTSTNFIISPPSVWRSGRAQILAAGSPSLFRLPVSTVPQISESQKLIWSHQRPHPPPDQDRQLQLLQRPRLARALRFPSLTCHRRHHSLHSLLTLAFSISGSSAEFVGRNWTIRVAKSGLSSPPESKRRIPAATLRR